MSKKNKPAHMSEKEAFTLAKDILEKNRYDKVLTDFLKFCLQAEPQDDEGRQNLYNLVHAKRLTPKEVVHYVLGMYYRSWKLNYYSPGILDHNQATDFLNNSFLLDVAELNKKPYLSTVKVDKEYKKGDVVLTLAQAHCGEIMQYPLKEENTKPDKPLKTIAVVILDDDFKYPTLSYQDENWMTITPSEIITMQDDIQDMHGDICVFGLGLGYFAFMAGIKDNVSSITIIDNNQDIIDLFNEHLLPQFPCKEKITIINSDAFEYMKSIKDDTYDCIYVDIWHDPRDVESYVKSRKLLSHLTTPLVRYWIEWRMINSLQSSASLEFSFRLFHKCGLPMPFDTSDLDVFSVNWARAYAKTIPLMKSKDKVLKALSYKSIYDAVIELDV